MKTAEKFFTKEERERIKEAVAAAEKQTSGEIVPVLATASGDYDRAEDIAGLWLGCLGTALLWIFGRVSEGTGGWGGPEHTVLIFSLWHFLLVIIGGFMIGAVITQHVGPLRRLFVGRGIMRRCVEEAARRAFYEHRLRATKESTGILIYVSLFERMVCVLGDDAISVELSGDDWQQVRDAVVRGLKAGRGADGFAEGIALCGRMLEKRFPIQPDDVNELSNELRIIA